MSAKELDWKHAGTRILYTGGKYSDPETLHEATVIEVSPSGTRVLLQLSHSPGSFQAWFNAWNVDVREILGDRRKTE